MSGGGREGEGEVGGRERKKDQEGKGERISICFRDFKSPEVPMMQSNPKGRVHLKDSLKRKIVLSGKSSR